MPVDKIPDYILRSVRPRASYSDLQTSELDDSVTGDMDVSRSTQVDRDIETLRESNYVRAHAFVRGISSQTTVDYDQRNGVDNGDETSGLSLIEREIRGQRQREAEVAALRAFVYRDVSDRHDVTETATTSLGSVSNSRDVAGIAVTSLGSGRESSHDGRVVTSSDIGSNVNHKVAHVESSKDTLAEPPCRDVIQLDMRQRPALHVDVDVRNDDTVKSTSGGSVSTPGESLILRELMEQKQREEELRERWKTMGFELPLNDNDISDDEDATDLSLNEDVGRIKAEGVQKDASHVPRLRDVSWIRQDDDYCREDVKVTSSDDVLLRESSERRQSGQRVQPLEDPDVDMSARLPYEPQQESMIAREIRLAQEREHVLRQSRGWITSQKSKDIEIPLGGRQHSLSAQLSVDFTNLPPMKLPQDAAKDVVAVKRFSQGRIQQEIRQERERELELRRLGSIHTTSDERIGDPFKYVEMIATTRDEDDDVATSRSTSGLTKTSPGISRSTSGLTTTSLGISGSANGHTTTSPGISRSANGQTTTSPGISCSDDVFSISVGKLDPPLLRVFSTVPDELSSVKPDDQFSKQSAEKRMEAEVREFQRREFEMRKLHEQLRRELMTSADDTDVHSHDQFIEEQFCLKSLSTSARSHVEYNSGNGAGRDDDRGNKRTATSNTNTTTTTSTTTATKTNTATTTATTAATNTNTATTTATTAATTATANTNTATTVKTATATTSSTTNGIASDTNRTTIQGTTSANAHTAATADTSKGKADLPTSQLCNGDISSDTADHTLTTSSRDVTLTGSHLTSAKHVHKSVSFNDDTIIHCNDESRRVNDEGALDNWQQDVGALDNWQQDAGALDNWQQVEMKDSFSPLGHDITDSSSHMDHDMTEHNDNGRAVRCKLIAMWEKKIQETTAA